MAIIVIINSTNISLRQSDLKQDALLLLGKMYYVTSQYEKALKVYEDLKLDDLSVAEINSRKMKLVGEAFAVKGRRGRRTRTTRTRRSTL